MATQGVLGAEALWLSLAHAAAAMLLMIGLRTAAIAALLPSATVRLRARLKRKGDPTEAEIATASRRHATVVFKTLYFVCTTGVFLYLFQDEPWVPACYGGPARAVEEWRKEGLLWKPSDAIEVRVQCSLSRLPPHLPPVGAPAVATASRSPAVAGQTRADPWAVGRGPWVSETDLAYRDARN